MPPWRTTWRPPAVHLLVVAPLKVDEMPLARSGDLHHREAVRGGIGKRHKAVEEARSGHCQADAGFLVRNPAAAAAWPASLS